MKKKKLIVASSIGLVVVIGAVVAGLVLSSALATKANGNAANGSRASGAIVIAWNKELLHIVQTPGAQPATIHPTRSLASLHAAIYDAVAARLIAIRANDGSATTPQPCVPGNQPGNYQLTPPNFVAPVFTNWGDVTPFVLNNAAQFRPGPPPALTSQTYAQALNEVKSLSQNTSTTRTPEQTVIAKFWAGPPWNLWNEIAENAALAHHTNLETTARLFTVLNLSLADSVITFYDAKYHYQLWRPVTAIRLAKTAGNPAIVGDPAWTPLVATALDPDYPAAHAVISADAATVLSAFFGNQDQIRATSDVLPGVVASYTSYSDIATEAGLSRIYAGNHTRIEVNAGDTLGNSVAQFAISDLGV